MTEQTTPARGTRDILPAEAALRDAVTAEILRIYKLHGFTSIETPAIETLSRLEGSNGGDNTKLIFKILKRGDKLTDAQENDDGALADLGLRFDLTVPLARYYANNRDQLPSTFKAIQIGPVWRAERPQKGRYRQLVQCDIDVFGSSSPLIEAELLVAGGEALEAVGLTGFTIRINHRKILAAIAADAGFPAERFDQFCVILDKADKIGISGVMEELRAAGYPNDAIARLGTIFERIDAQKTMDVKDFASVLHDPASVSADLIAVLSAIKAAVEQRLNGTGTITYDYTLVRGMGYYTGTIFEFGYQDYPFSICGGGRYDGMVRNKDGTPVPACGLSVGFERVILILSEQKSQLGASSEKIALIASPNAPMQATLEVQASYIRQKTSACIVPREKNFRRQMEQLQAAGFPSFLIIEDDGKIGDVRSTAPKEAV